MTQCKPLFHWLRIVATEQNQDMRFDHLNLKPPDPILIPQFASIKDKLLPPATPALAVPTTTPPSLRPPGIQHTPPQCCATKAGHYQ